MKIVTYNLRCVYRGDGINGFIHRAGLVLDTIAQKSPDIICFQEATEEIIDFLRRTLSPAYTLLLNQREKDLSGEGLAVAYRQDKCALCGLEAFWLSPTPQVSGSRFPEQSIYPRICQKLLFKSKATGKVFRIYNLHLDEKSEDVRVKQMELVLREHACETWPTLVLGDLNTMPDENVCALCKNFGLVDLTENIPPTFHDYGRRKPFIKIDYIFADSATATAPYNTRLWDESLDGIYLSDHYPIELTCEL